VRILVIGSGGREHAIVRALSLDPAVTELHAAPGNPGIAALAHLHEVKPNEPADVARLAASVRADLVVIGPEAPLVAGAGDAVRAAGIPVFGPSAAAARIEGSKAYSKDIMRSAGIPTAAAITATSAEAATEALQTFGPPYVVKDDALAAGKGVVVTEDLAAAKAHAASCGTVVIEEYLDGPEVSLFALADGATAVPLLPAQDFKRARDGDQGPNTGGMGAYTPLPWAPNDLVGTVMGKVVQPAIDELARRGTPYQGLLYAGLALTSGGIRVVEFNARFGDPETQVVLDRLATPLAGLLRASATGDLKSAPELKWHKGAAVTVVLAAEGYPENPVKGDPITIDWAARPDAYLLHAGTSLTGAGGTGDRTLVSSGGRVLNAVGTGKDLEAARAAAYDAVTRVEMRGGWYRRDIAAVLSRSPPGQLCGSREMIRDSFLTGGKRMIMVSGEEARDRAFSTETTFPDTAGPGASLAPRLTNPFRVAYWTSRYARACSPPRAPVLVASPSDRSWNHYDQRHRDPLSRPWRHAAAGHGLHPGRQERGAQDDRGIAARVQGTHRTPQRSSDRGRLPGHRAGRGHRCQGRVPRGGAHARGGRVVADVPGTPGGDRAAVPRVRAVRPRLAAPLRRGGHRGHRRLQPG
jgi:phosphoribosylamine--glycine ligase